MKVAKITRKEVVNSAKEIVLHRVFSMLTFEENVDVALSKGHYEVVDHKMPDDGFADYDYLDVINEGVVYVKKLQPSESCLKDYVCNLPLVE